MTKDYLKQLNETRELANSLSWGDKDFYGNYLAQTYYFVCHSTRLLARSASHFGVDREGLYRRFVNHMGEEDRHEKLASKDLENIGLSLDDFPELSITKAFWETQYYKIDQSSGISLLGYILYLEAIAVHCFDASFEVVQKEYGSKGSSFMRVHIDEDPEHVKHAIESIDSLSDHERELVWENFYQTADLYHHMLLKVQSFCRSKSVAA